MKRFLAILMSFGLLFCTAPVFPITAEDGTTAEEPEDYIYYYITPVDVPSAVNPGATFTVTAEVMNDPAHPIKRIDPGEQGDVSWDGWEGSDTYLEKIPLRFTCKVSPTEGMGKTQFGAYISQYIMTEDGQYQTVWSAWSMLLFEVWVNEIESLPPASEPEPLPESRWFIVLNKCTRTAQKGEYHVLSLMEIPYRPFAPYSPLPYEGEGFPTYILSDDRDDPLVSTLVADAEYGDVIECGFFDFGDAQKGGYEEIYRAGEHSEKEYCYKLCNALTDYDYDYDYYTRKVNGSTVLSFTGQDGRLYYVYPDNANVDVTFVPENSLPELGDINHDNKVNATDAAVILLNAAYIGAGGKLEDTDLFYECDINGDGDVNASDAALVLQYAAYSGAEEKPFLDLRSYLYERDGTVLRVAVGYVMPSPEVIISREELERYFEKLRFPRNIGTVDWRTARDEDVVRAEILARYPEEFFAEHHLVALCAHEQYTNTCQLIRSIRKGGDDSLAIDMHHLTIGGEPYEGIFTVLVTVDSSVYHGTRITVDETYETRAS